MKRLSVFVFAMLLAGSLSFAQTGGGSGAPKATSTPPAEGKVESGKKATKTSKAHKGGKKGKKTAGGTTTTTAPK
jgi:hypothetical protein